MDKRTLISIIREEIAAELSERELSKAELKKREDIVQALKPGAKKMKKKYGDDWKSVMYAIATKQAKAGSEPEDKKDDSDSTDEATAPSTQSVSKTLSKQIKNKKITTPPKVWKKLGPGSGD